MLFGICSGSVQKKYKMRRSGTLRTKRGFKDGHRATLNFPFRLDLLGILTKSRHPVLTWIFGITAAILASLRLRQAIK